MKGQEGVTFSGTKRPAAQRDQSRQGHSHSRVCRTCCNVYYGILGLGPVLSLMADRAGSRCWDSPPTFTLAGAELLSHGRMI